MAMPHTVTPEKARRVTFNLNPTVHSLGKAPEPDPGSKGEARGTPEGTVGKKVGPPEKEADGLRSHRKNAKILHGAQSDSMALGKGLGLSSESSDKGTLWPW